MQDSVVTQQQIDALERVLDKVFAQVGIDVEFTRHFLDRVNDERNRKQITVKELALLFKKEFQRWGREIAKLGPDSEAVMKDLDSDINIPFALKWNGRELELIAKTVMRKSNFRTSNKEFPVENIENYAKDFVKEMRDVLERELTGGEKRSKEAHYKKLKKHKGDFEKRYGKDADSVMHAVATKRAKGESTEPNAKHAVPDNRFTPGMNKGGGVPHEETGNSLKRAIGIETRLRESSMSTGAEFMDDLDWDFSNLPRMDWGAYEDNELEEISDYLYQMDLDDQSNDTYDGMYARAMKYVDNVLKKRGVTEAHDDMRPDHEVEMAKSDLYNLAKNSIALYELIQNVSEEQGLEGWQQGKITQANDYITSVYQSMSHEVATEATQTELDADEVDEFHKDLDDLVHKHLGHSSDEINEAAPKIDPDKWAEYQASKQKPKKVSSTQKSLASIRQKTEGGMKRVATTQSNKTERMASTDKQGLETFKKKPANENKDADYHKTLASTKNSDEGIAALKKKHGMSHDKAVATMKRLMDEGKVEESQLNELDILAPKKVYVRIGDGSYKLITFRSTGSLFGSGAWDRAMNIKLSDVDDATAKKLQLDQRLDYVLQRTDGTYYKLQRQIQQGHENQGGLPFSTPDITVYDVNTPEWKSDVPVRVQNVLNKNLAESKRWKQTSMSPEAAAEEFGKENVRVKKGALRNGDDMVEVYVEGKAYGPTGVSYYVPSGHKDEVNPKTGEKYPERQKPGYKNPKEAVAEGQYDASDIMYEDPPIGIDFDFDNLPKVDWSKYSKEDIEKFVVSLENLDFEDGVDVSNTGYSGSYRKAANWVEKNVLNKMEQSAPKIDPDKWAEYQASKEKPKKMSSTLKSLADIRAKADSFGEAHPNDKRYDDCWDGYEKVPGKKRGEKGSCRKIDEEITLEDTQDFHEEFGYLAYSLDENDLFEAEYQGRTVKLNKPMAGDVKKFKVYVKDPSTGNVKKVNFGQKGVRIKKDNPDRRRSFRARHNCDNPGPKTKARYWSCRKW